MKFSLRSTQRVGQLTFDFDTTIDCQALHIRGESGAGKTSLIESIVGFRQVLDFCSLDDEVIESHERRVPMHLRRIGYVPQDTLLFTDRDVSQNLKSANVAIDESEFKELVSMFELDGLLKRKPRQLSGGEQKRVALARALLSKPRLMILDEPLAGLDDARRENVFSAIEKMQNLRKIPLIWVSHDRSASERVCDREVVLIKGKLNAS